MKRKTFTRVRNLDTGKKGTVVDILDSQITVDYDDGTFGFLMFKWLKVDWIIITEENNNETGDGK